MNPYLQEILTLLEVGAAEAKAFADPNSEVAKGAGLSQDLLQAIGALLNRHASNQGMTAAEVLATL